MDVNLVVPPAVVISPTGVQGPRGNSVLSGTGMPGPTTGIDGDYYTDTTNYPMTVTLYGPKAGGAWPSPGVVVGGGGSVGALIAVNNLDDVPDKPLARDNLGLGAAAALDVGAAAGTVAAGDDSRFGEIAGIPIGGTPAAGKVPTLTSPTAGAWQTPSGGSGSSIRTAQARVTDDNLSGLPVAAAWVVAITSGGTPLQCSIAAAPDDRIEVHGNFMYAGAHFLDWVLLDSGGAIALYSTSGTSTPGSEGNPTMYPSLSFSKDTSADMFTVGPGDIDGNGHVTIGLAHMGSAAAIVYAHTVYPWRLRLHNIGPEPT